MSITKGEGDTFIISPSDQMPFILQGLNEVLGSYDNASSCTEGTDRFLSLPDIGPKYEVLEIIGQGGMSVILKTRHRILTRIRAVKLLRSESAPIRPSILARFRQEAMIASDLFHPNVIRIYDFDTAPNGVPFIVMEYLVGESLEKQMERERIISLPRTAALLTGVADALDAVHRVGVIHRDLKPANLFITEEGPVKILDFGISHIARGNTPITLVGEIVGTLLYMAPEQLLNQPLTYRADIFSLGATAMEMLTGKRIVETDNLRALLGQMLDPNPLVHMEDLEELPEHAAKAIVRVLSKNPAERFASASSFIQALSGENSASVSIAFDRRESSAGGFTAQHITVDDSKDASAKDNLSDLGDNPSHFQEWILIAVLFAIMGSMFTLFNPSVQSFFFGNDAVVSFLVSSGNVDLTDGDEDKWLNRVLPNLIVQYLNLDARASAAVLDQSAKERIPKESVRVSFLLKGRENDYTLVLKADNLPGKRAPWVITTQGPSIESVVESSTFRLGESLLGRIVPKTVRKTCTGKTDICLAEHTAEEALTQKFFLRAARLASGLLLESRDSFALFAYRYIQCTRAPNPAECRNRIPIPASDVPDRSALLRLIAVEKKGPTDEINEICELSKSEDALVRVIAEQIQGVDRCTTQSRNSICSRKDTFFSRWTCLRDSEMEDDDPDTLRRQYRTLLEIRPELDISLEEYLTVQNCINRLNTEKQPEITPDHPF